MFPRPADVQRRYSIAQGGSGIMVHIAIEHFLKNSSEKKQTLIVNNYALKEKLTNKNNFDDNYNLV